MADPLKDLVNDGFLRINHTDLPSHASSSPILILGPARSATSMLAGALHKLGCHCGDGAVDPTFEDTRIRKAINDDDWKEVAAIASTYTRQHSDWFFKWTVPGREPFECTVLQKLYCALGKPQVFVTYKDIFSIANRNRISTSSDIFAALRRATASYETIRRFLEMETPDALLVSTEKALHNKSLLIENLIQHSRLTPTKDQHQAALDFVEPNPWKYLVMTRSDLCIGYVAPIEHGTVKGWAKYKVGDADANVILTIDEKEIATTKANIYRKDLQQAGHRDGKCAFQFDDIDLDNLISGSVVSVRVEGDSQDLSNSPQIIGQ